MGERHDERSNNDNKGSTRSERGFNDGEQDSDDESESNSDKDWDEDEGLDGGAETDGGLGFEYDDEYMA